VTIGTDTSPERLAVLLRLLDDDSPPVRASVENALGAFGGDVSELLGESGVQLDATNLELLSVLLMPARRERLRREWVVPAGGADAVQDDWDLFEALLRSISDYLHDGVTLRQPVGDALDLLAEELELIASEEGAAGINRTLFESGRLAARQGEEDDGPCAGGKSVERNRTGSLIFANRPPPRYRCGRTYAAAVFPVPLS